MKVINATVEMSIYMIGSIMRFLKFAFVTILASLAVQADEGQIPEPFRGQTSGSQVGIRAIHAMKVIALT